MGLFRLWWVPEGGSPRPGRTCATTRRRCSAYWRWRRTERAPSS
ncbi:hypothetical protein NKH77_18505 [Streptomyces sp. M19]